MVPWIIHVLINRLPNRRKAAVAQVSRLSFGIYLIHMFVMRSFLWKIHAISLLPRVLQIALIAVATMVISFGAVWLISQLPFSKYIIGV